jgi:hypothetical protein
MKKKIRDSPFTRRVELSGILLDMSTCHSGKGGTPVSKNQSEAILSYLGIFQSLADEFKDRRFVLLFDQFESTKKASVEFLINFVNRMPDKFHIVVSFRTEGEEHIGSVSSDSASIELYEYARRNLNKAEEPQ